MHLTPEVQNDASVVETVSAIEDDPTFTSIPSTSVPPMTGMTSSSYEDVLQSDQSHKNGSTTMLLSVFHA